MPSPSMVADLIKAYAGTRKLPEIARDANIDYQRLRNIVVPVPVVGSASAGTGAKIHPDEYNIYVPASMVAPDSRAWEAEGDSMMPWLHPGDIVLARPHKVFRVGYAMLLRNADGEAMVKIIHHDGKEFVLHSLNPNYPDIPAQVEIIGYVTGRYRSMPGYEMIEHQLTGLRPPI